MKLIGPLLCLALLAGNVSAQDYKYETSEAIDISREGWNKVLQMRNGNTLFFHFEPRKGIVVKVFDKTHKEIASQKHVCKLLDINMLDRSFMDGIVDIGGEGVLFITQDLDNKETTIRLRIDATTGKLLGEDKVIQSASFQNKTTTDLLKLPTEDTYYFVASQGKAGFHEKTITINEYNGKNELKKTIPVTFDQKGYNDVVYKKARIDRNGGVMVAVELSKIIQYPDLHEKTLLLAYLPKGADSVRYTRVVVPNSYGSYTVLLTHNSYANSLNVLLSGDILGYMKNGLSKQSINIGQQSLLIINEDFSGKMTAFLDNKKLRNYIHTQTDTNQNYNSHAFDMYTNRYGLSTVVYTGDLQSNATYGWVNNAKGSKSAIGITQYNDKGEEVFGSVIPYSKLKLGHLSYPVVFHTTSVGEINQLDYFNTKNDFYFMYNELSRKYDQPLAAATDSVYNCYETNAVCSRLNKKKELTKALLFGKQEPDDFRQVYPGSTHYNEQTGTYALVFLHTKGTEIKTKLAWFQLEP
jgi:hypothetical protein